MRTLPLVVLGFAASCAACADTPQSPKLPPGAAQAAKTLADQGRTQGLVIGLVEGGQSATFAFGTIDQQKPEPPDADSVFEIGSITKTFTALLLADASTRKELRFDEPVDALLNGWKVPDGGGRKITLLDLATQSSGLPRLPENLQPKDLQNPYKDYSVADLRAGLASLKLVRQPGQAYEYSNLGFGLLGEALGQRCKASFGELLAARITGPLGLRNTSVSMTPQMQSHFVPGHAAGHLVPGWDMGALEGAGVLKSSVRDMLIYLQAHMQPSQAPENLRGALVQVAQPQRPAMEGARIGLAWHIQGDSGQEIIWHNGGTGGYSSFIGFTADRRRGVVILANSSAPEVTSLGFRALLGDAPAPSEVSLDPKTLNGYVGTYALAPTFKLTITIDAGQLYAQATGQAKFPIFASGPDAFFYKVVDARLTFDRSPDGKVCALVLHQNGQHIRGAKE